MNKSTPKAKNKNSTNQLRIIGGQWRGRKLSFPTLEGLRPTPDRVRETLFNWLNTSIINSRCLDLFAGSGALGLEALSRGASHVDLIDNAHAACCQLKVNLQTLKATNADIYQANAEQWLKQNSQQNATQYDVIFLDPPFHFGLAANCINLIGQSQLVTAGSWVYLEMARSENLPTIPASWQLHRDKHAGQVCYRLFRVENSNGL